MLSFDTCLKTTDISMLVSLEGCCHYAHVIMCFSLQKFSLRSSLEGPDREQNSGFFAYRAKFVFDTEVNSESRLSFRHLSCMTKSQGGQQKSEGLLSFSALLSFLAIP